jgi:hypothetical protein
VDASAQALEPENGWVRMRVLRDDDVPEIERESDRVEVELPIRAVYPFSASWLRCSDEGARR